MLPDPVRFGAPCLDAVIPPEIVESREAPLSEGNVLLNMAPTFRAFGVIEGCCSYVGLFCAERKLCLLPCCGSNPSVSSNYI